MSSHREAPEISKDPVADSTDVYAFVSPDRPGFVTLIANYIPLQNPAGGPNFFEFGDDVLYEIHVDNDGDGRPDVTFGFRFSTQVRNPDTFLYNTGQITSIGDPHFNRPQFYTVTMKTSGRKTSERSATLGSDLACPPCNIGPHSTPNYENLAMAAVHELPNSGGAKVFAGQRLDGFYVDLGSVFDLLDLRPFSDLHVIPMPVSAGVDGLRAYNVHSIALQVPISTLTSDHTTPTDQSKPNAVIGVWTSASRQKAHVRDHDRHTRSGPFVQVSRLGNPLVNEALIPMSKKDDWNSQTPATDSTFNQYVIHPEVAGLLPGLYPGVFPNLAGYTKPRADLQAILHTGIPSGVIPGFQNFTGATQADELRLNVAIPPAGNNSSIFGILGNDLAGYPNGRRVSDHVFAIELRAIAGATIPLVDPSFTPDGAASAVTDGLTPPGNVSYLAHFPYLDHPKSGFDVVPPN